MTTIPTRPISSRAAWLAGELRGETDWIYRLSEADIADLDSAVRGVRARGLTLDEVTREEFPLPTLAGRIRDWLRELHDGRGFVLVKGVPVERYSEDDAVLVYWGIGRHLGTAVSQNADGDLLGHVRDVGADPDDPNVRLYKTRAKQDFHTDGSDLIGLLCLRTARSGGESQIASSVTIFNEVLRRRPDLLPLLFEPFCWDRHGGEPAGELPYWTFPICTYKDGQLRTFFAAWYIWQAQRHRDVPRLTPSQIELIELIEEIAHDPEFHLDMDFEVGDMQLLKNSVTLHARGEYEDWDEPERRRHLLRLWLSAGSSADSDTTL
jgi:hypothetical protein